ncbi:exostosin family protein [Wolffia australiana]
MSSGGAILLFLLAAAATAATGQAELCDGRRIHIRRLPARFNDDLLLNCSAYTPLYDDLCPYLANDGLGEKTFDHSVSWYRSDSAALEPLFHRRLLDYPCLEPNPLAADAIFLPYYASLDALRYLYGPEINSSADHGLDLFEFLTEDSPRIWDRRRGHDHFLVMAGPAWDFSQSLEADPPVWGTSFLQLPEFFNVTALVLESRRWAWQEQAVPYLTSFHPPSQARLEAWLGRARRARRRRLMMFAGGAAGGPGSPPNIRRSIRAECENRSELCELVDCAGGVCAREPVRYVRPMLRSVFCLQPPGQTPTRRSTFDAIVAGCIPVFFQEDSAQTQYAWHLPEEEFPQFSVLIPKEDVVAGGISIAETLLAVPQAEIRRMREKLLQLAPRVVYRPRRSAAKDAVDLAIEGVLAKIARRVEFLV